MISYFIRLALFVCVLPFRFKLCLFCFVTRVRIYIPVKRIDLNWYPNLNWYPKFRYHKTINTVHSVAGLSHSSSAHSTIRRFRSGSSLDTSATSLEISFDVVSSFKQFSIEDVWFLRRLRRGFASKFSSSKPNCLHSSRTRGTTRNWQREVNGIKLVL